MISIEILRKEAHMNDEEIMEMLKKHPGNAPQYDVSSCMLNENSPLYGKRIIFLGSSVTYGAASFAESFVEYLQAEDGVIPYKEAVSSTTLADVKEGSYVQRVQTIPADFKADAFICQLSTNDATKGAPLGKAGDTSVYTAAGAISWIIDYAKKTWNCPIFFYTGTKFDNPRYEQMIEMLYEIQKTKDFGIIDFWNHPMNEISSEDYSLYMADGIHPVKAGYRLWWTPEFRKFLIKNL